MGVLKGSISEVVLSLILGEAMDQVDSGSYVAILIISSNLSLSR